MPYIQVAVVKSLPKGDDRSNIVQLLKPYADPAQGVGPHWKTTISVPRARLETSDGGTIEWKSKRLCGLRPPHEGVRSADRRQLSCGHQHAPCGTCSGVTVPGSHYSRRARAIPHPRKEIRAVVALLGIETTTARGDPTVRDNGATPDHIQKHSVRSGGVVRNRTDIR